MIRKKHHPVHARVPVEIPLVLRTVCVDLIVVPKIWRVAIVFSKLTPPIKPSRNAWLEWSETPYPERKNVVTVKWHVTVMIRKKHPPVHVRVPVRIHSVLRTVCVETIAVSKVMNLRIPMMVTRTPPLLIKPLRNATMEPNATPCPEQKSVVTVRLPVIVMIRKKHPPVHVRVPVRIHSVLRTVCVETIVVSKVTNLRIPMTVLLLLLPLRMNLTLMVMMPPNWPAPIMRILDLVPTV